MTKTSSNPEQQQDDFFDKCYELLEEIESFLQEDIKDLNELKPILEKKVNGKGLCTKISQFMRSEHSLDKLINKMEDAKKYTSELRTKLDKEVGEREARDVRNLIDRRNKRLSQRKGSVAKKT
ncbi:hypothetical protein [Nostoc sp. GT001]|uniref:hypothetical protein n=1 Tax=Nostoc sp. GT001 TaxID=3056647 RepID=UPI0025AA9FBE|nr:hypothetical protein [Nostoc sp. GT001]MDM9582076.1 hypothetical protein [Nostoc sp. GT001]